MPKSTTNPNAPVSSAGVSVRRVEAMTEPIATVMAKSKLDNFEKLRNPTIRVKRISVVYMPIPERKVINRVVLFVVIQLQSIINYSISSTISMILVTVRQLRAVIETLM